MKLKDWAVKTGIDYQTAYRWFKDNKLPVRAYQSKSGSIIVDEENIMPQEKKETSSEVVSKLIHTAMEYTKNKSSILDYMGWITDEFILEAKPSKVLVNKIAKKDKITEIDYHENYNLMLDNQAKTTERCKKIREKIKKDGYYSDCEVEKNNIIVGDKLPRPRKDILFNDIKNEIIRKDLLEGMYNNTLLTDEEIEKEDVVNIFDIKENNECRLLENKDYLKSIEDKISNARENVLSGVSGSFSRNEDLDKETLKQIIDRVKARKALINNSIKEYLYVEEDEPLQEEIDTFNKNKEILQSLIEEEVENQSNDDGIENS
jgi:hypothetical protein